MKKKIEIILNVIFTLCIVLTLPAIFWVIFTNSVISWQFLAIVIITPIWVFCIYSIFLSSKDKKKK